MYNYCNTLNHNLKRGILKFSEKISKNFSRPEFKFVSQMMYGILSSQSCMLSEISRKLEEKTSVKKIIDRLSRNLKEFDKGNELFENYLKAVKSEINDKTILIVDGSDITKDYTTKMECIATVRDGSTGEYKLGYHTLGITALTPEKKMPIPVYSRIYSQAEQGYVSEDEETINGLKFLSSHFNKNNIRAFDRGYDNNRYYEYLIKNEEKFVIRAKKNRDVIYNGKRINVLELAHKFKGKYSLKFKKKNGINADCKITIIPIRLVCRPKDDLNLVVCYGFGKEPMLIITNLQSTDKRLGVAVVKVYLMRWRIEEYYRFKKQQFGYENLRVRSLNSIRNLDLLLTITMGYIGVISEKSDERATVMQIIEYSKRIYGANKFVFYAIADGLFAVLSKCKQGISDMLTKKPKSMQLSLFDDVDFGWC
ncbi:MAG: transposase [bacterium]|nr:transposase [bacterium]